jgi:hypothetical protein
MRQLQSLRWEDAAENAGRLPNNSRPRWIGELKEKTGSYGGSALPVLYFVRGSREVEAPRQQNTRFTRVRGREQAWLKCYAALGCGQDSSIPRTVSSASYQSCSADPSGQPRYCQRA